MVILRKCKSVVRILKRNIDWNRDAQKYRALVNQNTVKRLPKKRIIILMPHADDEWIGCSQLLQNYSKEILVINMDMDGGDNQSLHIKRRREAENVARRLQYRFITLQGDKVKALTRIFNEEKAEGIFLPCYFDWHKEHIETMEIFQKSYADMEHKGLVAMYQVSLPIPFSLINAGIEMDKSELKKKWKCFKQCYKTQNFLPVRRFAINEYINGGITNSFACEGFLISSFEIWQDGFQKYKFDEKTAAYFQKNLHDIKGVRDSLDLYISSKKGG